MTTPTDIDGVYPFCGLTRHDNGSVPAGLKDHGSSIKWWAHNMSNAAEDEEVPDDEIPDEGL